MALSVCQVCAVDFTVDKFLIPLIDGMEREGWKVTTVCSEGPAIPRLRSQGYQMHTIQIARSINPFKALRSIYFLYKYFKSEKFDIIHVHTPVASLLARIAAKFACESYVIYTAHGFYFHDEMPVLTRKLFIYIEKFAGKFTHLLFCQSKEDAEDAASEGIMPANDIITIGNGVDVENYNLSKYEPFFKEIRDDLNIPSSAKVIGIVARKVKEKGYIDLLEAAVLLKKKHPDLYILLVGGKLGSDHDSGIEQALQDAKTELGDCLIDTGLSNDVPRLISVMDIFCLPSHREGMPRTIIEAMFLKKPVVATNIRGCREEVIHGQTGLLVPVGNVKELFEAIDYMLNNQNIAVQMGELGFKVANDFFNEKNVIKLQIDSIKERLNV